MWITYAYMHSKRDILNTTCIIKQTQPVNIKTTCQQLSHRSYTRKIEIKGTWKNVQRKGEICNLLYANIFQKITQTSKNALLWIYKLNKNYESVISHCHSSNVNILIVYSCILIFFFEMHKNLKFTELYL